MREFVPGLVIDEPWITHIVDKKDKDLELRKVACRSHRGENIVLIRKGTGLIVADAYLSDSQELTINQLVRLRRRHQCSRQQLLTYAGERSTLHAWQLKNIRRFREPVPYEHPQGAQSWVRIPVCLLTHGRG